MYKKAIIKQNNSCVCVNVDDTLPADNIFCIIFLVKSSDKLMIMIQRQNIELLNSPISEELHNFDISKDPRWNTAMCARIIPREQIYKNHEVDIKNYIDTWGMFESFTGEIVPFAYEATSKIYYMRSTDFMYTIWAAFQYLDVCKLHRSEVIDIMGCINTELNNRRLNHNTLTPNPIPQ